MHADKLEAIKQWTHDPCGFSVTQGITPYSEEFYQRIDQNRYEEYAPWMKAIMPFGQFPDKKLLEIGFGMGTDLFQFAAAGSHVYGVDLSPAHLEIAQKRFALYNVPANLRLADAENLPFKNETFDAVYSFGVIHHSPDTPKCIAEIHRVLKPGGRAIISVYHKNSAFTYLSIILSSYILRLRFLREPFRKTISRIEYRSRDDACPLVKVYSRSEYGAMLRSFRKTMLQCAHLERSHFGPLKWLVPDRFIKKYESKLGWYLIATAEK